MRVVVVYQLFSFVVTLCVMGAVRVSVGGRGLFFAPEYSVVYHVSPQSF